MLVSYDGAATPPALDRSYVGSGSGAAYGSKGGANSSGVGSGSYSGSGDAVLRDGIAATDTPVRTGSTLARSGDITLFFFCSAVRAELLSSADIRFARSSTAVAP